MGKYVMQVLIAVDQLFNALFKGWADETLSSRCWRAERDGKFYGKLWRPVIDTLFFFEPNHCFQSYVSERKRLQLAPEFRLQNTEL